MSNHKIIIALLIPSILALLGAIVFRQIFIISAMMGYVFIGFTIWICVYLAYIKAEKLRKYKRISDFKNHTLDTVLKVSHLFMDMDQNEDYYNFILKSAIDVVEKASRGSFLIHNPLSGRYEFKTCIGYPLDQLQKISFALEETFPYLNAGGQYDQPIIIKDIAAYDSKLLDPSSNISLGAAGGFEPKESLSAPIVIEGKIVGILNIDSDLSGAFDEVDRQLIQFFSTQIAIALKNKKLVDETLNMSRYDSLTGIYNRNYFEKIFNAYRTHSLENMESYALVMCDLNDLKIINDHFGHSVGDLVLMEFTKIIKESIRESDVFARIGGDEFALLFRNTDAQKTEEKMSALVNKIESAELEHQRISIPMSFSYGTAISPDDSMVYDVLVRIADVRMYQYKDKNKKALMF
ncbi:MAG: GGDEF domain-containing protein [Clostridia bacterium]|nr:GGDEF domain-containing protein [Clostridia bacterium]